MTVEQEGLTYLFCWGHSWRGGGIDEERLSLGNEVWAEILRSEGSVAFIQAKTVKTSFWEEEKLPRHPQADT